MPKTETNEALLLIDDLRLMLAALGEQPTDADALRVQVGLKRIETAAKAVAAKLVPVANGEFNASKIDGKKLMINGGFISAYSKPAEYEYPVAITSLEQQVKALKEQAKKDGTATKTKQASAPDDRCFKVEAPFSGAPYAEYAEGANALAKFVR